MLSSDVHELPVTRLRELLSGLPQAVGYSVHVTPLPYEEKPHLSAWTDFELRSITIEIPDPFLPFGEIVPYAAKRHPTYDGDAMRFIWLTEGVTFEEPGEVVRFLYLHEWMHWYLKERLGKKSRAETACDRFALRNYRRRTVTIAHADAALRRGHSDEPERARSEPPRSEPQRSRRQRPWPGVAAGAAGAGSAVQATLWG